MSCGSSDCSRLCRLIDESLRPYTEPEAMVVSLTKEKEQQILIALSKVSKEIQLWTRKLHRCSDNGKEAESACSSEYSNSEDHHCLAKIVADLIVLLTLESQYVQHLAGNVLSFISQFLEASESDWERFIHLVCVCVELAMANTLSYSSAPSNTGAEDSSNSSNFYAVVKPRLQNTNWSTVAGIIRVLRNILKYLKQDYDEHLLEVYLDSVDSCLSNVRWDLLDESCDGQNSGSQKSFSADASFLRNASVLQKPCVMFLGTFLQLLCSLVGESDFVEATGVSIHKHPIHLKIVNLVPKVLYWCLGKQGDCVETCISQYFRHKLLVLMVRLSFQTRLECSTLVSWLQFLHTYFQEVLQQPITQPKSCQDDSLEGSPFLLSVSDGEINSLHSHHIQRQAVFLFLRLSFSLISQENTDKQCLCITPNSCLTYESNSDLECCFRKKGLLELYKWFQGNLPTEMFLNHELYFERCVKFASSFLQLFMHEDDILFKMLLQLLGVPFCAEQQLCNEERMFQDVKEDTLFHVPNLFNPVHLFHLFLSELHYDHQVLLDYLISKDTGISCAEYLLRCLRIVCDSWRLFVEFSLDGKVINQSSCKKRKVSLDGSNFRVDVTPGPVKNIGILTSLEKECNRDNEHARKHYITQPFGGARECLLLLRNSVDSLHKKKLFPYNPEVLLKRLTRFQELCFKEEK
ncbi:uncharacterized protein LOC132186487 isoform X1 [Corylus avellana]|uniref:uncharacterized protein LOC132186487 isoform X1 n=1 Tax=Corylus avellana TaxID=13451 RepID=UPI00286ABD83|nr:uncharacterized protein LOC132186487 isoform X1 [Corylus avellana]